jgi:hypothetical protein
MGFLFFPPVKIENFFFILRLGKAVEGLGGDGPV